MASQQEFRSSGLDALTSAAYGPEAAMALLILIPLGISGIPYILLPLITTASSSSSSSSSSATARPLQGLSRPEAAPTPSPVRTWAVPEAGLARRRRPDDRLHPHRSRRYLGRCHGPHLRRSPRSSLIHPGRSACSSSTILAVVNLRGVKDTGTAFIIPTFLFIGTLAHPHRRRRLSRRYAAGGQPRRPGGHDAAYPARPHDHAPHRFHFGVWIITQGLQLSGCAAMTGVEAVSNGVMAFGEPRAKKSSVDSHCHHRHPHRPAFRNLLAGHALPDHGDGP